MTVVVEKRQNNSGGQSQSQTVSSQTGSQSLTASPTPTIPLNAPPGLISVTQPPQQSTPLFKIAPSNPITFAWEFSNVIVAPTHLTVSAACENGNTYPVGPTDGIIPGTATSVVWDAYAYQTSHPQLPLAQAKYTLEIWGDQGPDAQNEPGFLAPNSAVHFSLYTPQGGSPITSGTSACSECREFEALCLAAGWSCPACSNAISHYDSRPVLVALVSTLLVMFLSGSLVMRRL